MDEREAAYWETSNGLTRPPSRITIPTVRGRVIRDGCGCLTLLWFLMAAIVALADLDVAGYDRVTIAVVALAVIGLGVAGLVWLARVLSSRR